MMTSHPKSPARILFRTFCTLLATFSLLFPLSPARAQAPPSPQQQKPTTQPPPDDQGPTTDNGTIILKKKKEADEPPPPAAPAEPKVKNPNGDTYSLRVDVPIVNIDANVVLDKTHQFVPGLKANNFLVLEDGVPQTVTSVRVAQTPITAVMLLEFAANSYYLINDMRTASYYFFRSLHRDDYVAVV